MDEVKTIKSEAQYDAYIEEVEALIGLNPMPGTQEADRLDLLTVVIEAYENQKFPVEAPDPIDAILFRMEEQGLKQADLVHYFGTRSRVSEVLSRKRPLTVQMIKALSIGLGISAETLIGLAAVKKEVTKDEIDWSKFPIKEIVSRGWLGKLNNTRPVNPQDVVQTFINQVGLNFGGASFKRSINGEAYSPSTKYALYAWLARVIQRARLQSERLGKFEHSALNASFLKELAQLSWFERGPLLAKEFLEKHGIALIIEPHLKGTSLDGAALIDQEGVAIIGLTLRADRLDNFWFTLLHEVAHLWKHVSETELFLDDLDASSEDRREIEANRIAKEAFIPRILWKRSEAYRSPTKESIEKLSRDLKIHPAIIAGRLRKEYNNYQMLTDMVGYGEVAHLFNQNLTM